MKKIRSEINTDTQAQETEERNAKLERGIRKRYTQDAWEHWHEQKVPTGMRAIHLDGDFNNGKRDNLGIVPETGEWLEEDKGESEKHMKRFRNADKEPVDQGEILYQANCQMIWLRKTGERVQKGDKFFPINGDKYDIRFANLGLKRKLLP